MKLKLRFVFWTWIFFTLFIPKEGHTGIYTGPEHVIVRGTVLESFPDSSGVPVAEGRIWVINGAGPVSKVQLKEIIASDSISRHPQSAVTTWVPWILYVPQAPKIQNGQTVEIDLRVGPAGMHGLSYFGARIEGTIVPLSSKKHWTVSPKVLEFMEGFITALKNNDQAALKDYLEKFYGAKQFLESSSEDMHKLADRFDQGRSRWYGWSARYTDDAGAEKKECFLRNPIVDRDGTDKGDTLEIYVNPQGKLILHRIWSEERILGAW